MQNKTNPINRGLRQAIASACCLAMLAGCDKPAEKPVIVHESLNATLWTQTAAEYAANVRQAYQLARINLQLALADPSWTAALEQDGDYDGLPPAIMLDLDQTVLDNSSYNVMLIREGKQYSKASYAAWCQKRSAPAVPGAAAFLDHAVERDVAVFYYSRRRDTLRDCTTSNLQALGLPLPDQSRLLLNDGTSKSRYRKQVAQQYRILLLVGDDLEDFVDDFRADPAVRRQLASRYAERWGREWIILPNPIYGHWESSLYSFDHSMTRPEKLRHKLLHLLE
jgi:acid phosphatase